MAKYSLVNSEDIYAIIARCLTNTGSGKEKQILQLWLMESDENRELFENIESYHNFKGGRKLSILKSEEIKKQIWKKINHKRYNMKNSYSSIKTIGILKIAAVFVLAICSIFAIYFQVNQKTPIQPTVKLITKSNDAGRKSTFQLKDGTIVNLNSESKISFHEMFSDSVRIVWLTGEAFFDIAKDTLKPFYVITKDLKVMALGTSFNVSGYADNSITKVSLSTGRVLVDLNNKDTSTNKIENIVLSPGQEIAYQKSTQIFLPVTGYNAQEVEGWKDGILYFKQDGLEQIIKKLERWYGTKIQVVSAPNKRISYSGLFERQNMRNVLTSIGFVISFDFEINDKNVILNFKEKTYEKTGNIKKDQ